MADPNRLRYRRLFNAAKPTARFDAKRAYRVGDQAPLDRYVYDDHPDDGDDDPGRIELAVNVALVTGRPLLVRGLPGTGKSTLAADVATKLGWRYYEAVVSSRTQARDLLWTFDPVRRLSDAQVAGASIRDGAASALPHDAAYITPGVLWWAFDPGLARCRGLSEEELAAEKIPKVPDPAEPRRSRRAVVLIDEIDKADPDVPNDLLVPLGAFRFTVDGTPVQAEEPPLVVITTNEERDLPRAFLRRCVTLLLKPPGDPRLRRIARSHFPDDPDDATLDEILVRYRAVQSRQHGHGAPEASIAEFLDAVAACSQPRRRPARRQALGARRGADARQGGPSAPAMARPAAAGDGRKRPELSLGDAVRALRMLRLPPAALPEVAAMLGLDVGPLGSGAEDAPAAAPATRPAARRGAPAAPPRPSRAPEPPPEAPPLPDVAEETTRRAELIPHPMLAGASDPPRRIRPLHELLTVPDAAPRAPADLLAPGRQRAVLGALASSHRDDGEIDVDALVRRIAAAEAVATIPRRPLLTTRLGVRLLADVGAGMLPFARDVERLAARIERLVGADGFERLAFDRSPLGELGVGDGPVWDVEALRRAASPAGGPAAPCRHRPRARRASRGARRDRAELARVRRRGRGGREPARPARPVSGGAVAGRPAALGGDRPLGPRDLGPRRGRGDRRKAAMSGPADRIEALRERNPGAAELALAVSLAVRVEPDLLRHARLLVGADATAEADLWWSDLVASQNSDGIMLAPDVAEELRARLAAPERHRLREDAWALVGSQHAGEHLAVRLEELVNWLSIAGGAEAEDRIEELLVAGAHEWMASSDVPGGGARWMLNALRRLPRRAAESQAGRALGVAAAAHTAGVAPALAAAEGELPPDALDNWFPWLLARLPSTTISVALVDGGIELEGDGEHAQPLPVPRTDPVTLELSWHDGAPRRRTVAVRPGERTAIALDADEVELATLAGQRFTLRRAGRRAADAGLDFSGLRAAHRPAAGLDALIEEIRAHVNRRDGWGEIAGAPGTGATTALCAALDALEADGWVVLQHFYGRGPAWWDDVETVFGSLVAQLRAAVPDLPALDAISLPSGVRSNVGKPGAALEVLLTASAERDGPRVVVAFDEPPAGNREELKRWAFATPVPSLVPPRSSFLAAGPHVAGIRDFLEDGDPHWRVVLGGTTAETVCRAYLRSHWQPVLAALGLPAAPVVALSGRDSAVALTRALRAHEFDAVHAGAADPGAVARCDAGVIVLDAEPDEAQLAFGLGCRERGIPLVVVMAGEDASFEGSEAVAGGRLEIADRILGRDLGAGDPDAAARVADELAQRLSALVWSFAGELIALAGGAIGRLRPLVDWLAAQPPGSADLERLPASLAGALPWDELSELALRHAITVVAVAQPGLLVRDVLWATPPDAWPPFLAALRRLGELHLLADPSGRLPELLEDDAREPGAWVEALGTTPLRAADPGLAEQLRPVFLGGLEGAHQWLAEAQGERLGEAPEYFARHAMAHAVAGGDAELVRRLCGGPALTRQARRLGVAAVAADLALARTLVDDRVLATVHEAVLTLAARAAPVAEFPRLLHHELMARLGALEATRHLHPNEAMRPLLEGVAEPLADDERASRFVDVAALLELSGGVAAASRDGVVRVLSGREWSGDAPAFAPEAALVGLPGPRIAGVTGRGVTLAAPGRRADRAGRASRPARPVVGRPRRRRPARRERRRRAPALAAWRGERARAARARRRRDLRRDGLAGGLAAARARRGRGDPRRRRGRGPRDLRRRRRPARRRRGGRRARRGGGRRGQDPRRRPALPGRGHPPGEARRAHAAAHHARGTRGRPARRDRRPRRAPPGPPRRRGAHARRRPHPHDAPAARREGPGRRRGASCVRAGRARRLRVRPGLPLRRRRLAAGRVDGGGRAGRRPGVAARRRSARPRLRALLRAATWFATGSEDGTVAVWTTDADAPLLRYRGHGAAVRTLTTMGRFSSPRAATTGRCACGPPRAAATSPSSARAPRRRRAPTRGTDASRGAPPTARSACGTRGRWLARSASPAMPPA